MYIFCGGMRVGSPLSTICGKSSRTSITRQILHCSLFKRLSLWPLRRRTCLNRRYRSAI